MNENDPKDTDSVETGTARETSRRDFLTAGAAAAAVVGAAATLAKSSSSEAATIPAPGSGVWEQVWEDGTGKLVRVTDKHYANDPELARVLANVILEVWDTYDPMSPPASYLALLSEDYSTVREQLADLSHKHGNQGTGGPGGPPGPNPSTARPNPTTKDQHDYQVYLTKPRVITQEMYNSGYVKADVEEIVFVLPKPPGTDLVSGKTGGTVRALMAAVPFGM